jgi:di/tricarboxylate transporter
MAYWLQQTDTFEQRRAGDWQRLQGGKVWLGGLNAQQLSFAMILVVAFGLLMTERIRSDLVAILVILALYLTRVLSPAEALSGFSSEPALVVAAIFVMSGALHQTALSDAVGHWIGRLAGHSYYTVIAVLMREPAANRRATKINVCNGLGLSGDLP